MSSNINYLIPQIHLNTIMSCAEETFKQGKSEFLGAAIEHLNQYPLTPEQNDKIRAGLENIASDNFEQVVTLPVCKTVALPDDIWEQVLTLLDSKSFHTLSIIGHLFNSFSRSYVEKYFPIALKDDRIINTGAKADDIRFFPKLKIVKFAQNAIQPQHPQSSHLSFKCLIMRQGLTWPQLLEDAESKGIYLPSISFHHESIGKILEGWKSDCDVIMISDQSNLCYNMTVNQTQDFLKEHAIELPSLFELVTFFVFKEKYFSKLPFSLTSSKSTDGKNLMTRIEYELGINADGKTTSIISHLKIGKNSTTKIDDLYVHNFCINGKAPF